METLYFAQISDLHISTLGDHDEMLSGRTADFLTGIIATLNRLEDLDFVLLSGDLFYTPTPQNLVVFQQVIQTLGKPYYVIPGNHDCSGPNSAEGLTRHQFAYLFNPQVQARPLAPEAQVGYWSLTIRPEIQLIGLDSVHDEDWGGFIDAMQIEWLKGELALHSDKFIVVAVHHPFHKLAPIDDHPDYRYFVCHNGPEMLTLLNRYPQVKVVLTGHHHQTKADLLDQCLHLACPALAVYPCAYRTLRLEQTEAGAWHIEWSTQPVADDPTLAEARQKMIEAWQGVGFDLDFVEMHAHLAYGSEWDRNGRMEGWRIGRVGIGK